MLYRVINCARHADRMAQFAKHARAAGLQVPRVECVDGSAFDERSICRMRAQGVLSPNADPSLSPVHVAIFLSHVTCWRALLRSKSEHMCVFEDDARVHPHFAACLAAIMARESELRFDVLHLVNGNWARTKRHQERVATVRCPAPEEAATASRSQGGERRAASPRTLRVLRETVPYNAGAGCYVIHRDFAAFLLRRAFPIAEEVDLFVGLRCLPELRRHLTLETYADEDGCWTRSPLLDVDCPYEDDTTTRTNHSSIRTNEARCG